MLEAYLAISVDILKRTIPREVEETYTCNSGYYEAHSSREKIEISND